MDNSNHILKGWLTHFLLPGIYPILDVPGFGKALVLIVPSRHEASLAPAVARGCALMFELDINGKTDK